MVGNIVKGGVYLPSMDIFFLRQYTSHYLFHFCSHPNFHSLNLWASLHHIRLWSPILPHLNPRWTSALQLNSFPAWIPLQRVTECPSSPGTRGPAPRKGFLQCVNHSVSDMLSEQTQKMYFLNLSVLLFLHRVSLSLICPPKTTLRGPSLCKRKMLLLRRRCCLIRTKRKKISLLHLSVSAQNSQMNQTPHRNHRA